MAAEGEVPLSRPQLIWKTITSLAISIHSILPPPPPLLPVATVDAHPITQNLGKLELGKFAITLGATATLGLLFSHKFPASEAHNIVVLGFMASCAAVWNGILFGRIILQHLGITLFLLCFYGLVGSFLPSTFSWACWLAGAFSLLPFLSILIKSLPPRS